MSLLNISEKYKNIYRKILYILVVVFLYLWYLLAGAELSLNSYILEINRNNVEDDVSRGVLTEVAQINTDGSFYLEGSEDKCSPDEINEYIRVPNGTKYYYDTNTKNFVSEVTLTESRNFILKFLILDIIISIMFIIELVIVRKKKALAVAGFVLWYLVTVFYSWCIYSYSFEVLFEVKEGTEWISIAKVAVWCLVWLILILKDCRKANNKPRKLPKKD